MPMSMEMPASVRTSQYGRIATRESSHSTPAMSMKPCCRPASVKSRPMSEMPNVISQNDQLPKVKDHSGRPRSLGSTYTVPPMAHTTKVPNTVRCEWEITKSLKWVGSWIERRASVEPWKQPTKYMSEPMMKNLAGRFPPKVCQRPIMVPKKFCSTVHTGTISSIEVMMDSVSAQSAIGLNR